MRLSGHVPASRRAWQGVRIFEVVGHEDQRHLECTAQAVDFSLKTSANGTVDGRERLVKQQHRGLSCQRSRERDALPFPAGQLVWPFRIVSNKVDEIQQFPGPGASFRSGTMPECGDDIAKSG